MPKQEKQTSHLRALPLLAVGAVIALLAAGCGTSKSNVQRGEVLFTQKCGGCHTLAQAGASGQIGPNLDDAFAAARAAGEGSSTIEGVVKAQVENPRPSTSNPAVSMPANVVTGQDLEDVAAFVGRYAGAPGVAKKEAAGGAGAKVFASSGCGGCHTLAAASASGTVGPNLDEVLPGQSAAMITESIVNPNAKIAKGYQANIMPPSFGSMLSKQELEQLVEYLIESTSKGGKKK